MNIEVRQPARAQKVRQGTRYGIVDCDIHPKLLIEDYRKHLSNQWWSYLQTYGLRPRHGYTKAYPMPKITPQAARRAYRGAVGRSQPVRNRARQFPPHHPAVRRPIRPGRCGTHRRTPAFG